MERKVVFDIRIPLILVALLAGCATAQRAPDGTPLEDCLLGICTPYTPAEKSNYRQYHVAFGRDRIECANKGWIAYRNSVEYAIALARYQNRLSGCSGPGCGFRLANEADRLRYDPDIDPVYRQCMLELGWVNPYRNGWRYGRTGADVRDAIGADASSAGG